MKIFDVFKRKKTKESGADRKNFLLTNGRITDGQIVDSNKNENGEEVVSYIYNIHGVSFESSEILTDEQLQNSIKYAPGAKVGVRYDPKNHGNSTLI
jgi:hypothetical protein